MNKAAEGNEYESTKYSSNVTAHNTHRGWDPEPNATAHHSHNGWDPEPNAARPSAAPPTHTDSTNASEPARTKAEW